MQGGSDGKDIYKSISINDEMGVRRLVSITRTDGRSFDIDRVIDVRQAPTLKAGGLGTRYTCKIRGKQVCLFCDERKWFVEG